VQTKTVQRRLRDLPSRVGVYFVLALGMYPRLGYARPGTDPDRASFTTAMEAAKDQLTAAAGICPDGPADLPGAIGRAVLATLMPARRPGSAPARSNAPPPGTQPLSYRNSP
jgi:Insertion element 4 transposase N-terminal